MVPGMRPGYFGPMMQPGQQGPRPGGRRSGDGPMRHQPQQPMPFMQPQVSYKKKTWHKMISISFYFASLL